MKKLIIGLGNPDRKYTNTRHNTGFIIVDHITRSLGLKFIYKKKLLSEISEYQNFIFAKPQTYMNRSGLAVSSMISFFKTDHDNLVVIHDDADLPFGEFKMQFQHGSAGHHGIENIIQSIKTKDFWRVRVGIGRSPNGVYDIESWVLADFSSLELEKLKEISFEIKSKLNID